MSSTEAPILVMAVAGLGVAAGGTAWILATWLQIRMVWEEESWLAATLWDTQSHPPLGLRAMLRQLEPWSIECWAMLGSGGAFATSLALITQHPGKIAMFLLLAAGLGTCALVDARIRLIPDAVTQPLLWLGLLSQLVPQVRTIGLDVAVIGAALGYMLPWVMALVFRSVGNSDAIGGGDLKMVALVGAWLGPAWSLGVLFIATAGLSLWFALAPMVGKRNLDRELPLGPWLAGAGLFAILCWLVRV